jgi:hypothetical protein
MLPEGIESPSIGEFHLLASRAAALGRSAIPDLMLLARDGRQPLARLCAICALGRMTPDVTIAREALRRIALLPEIGPHGYVVLGAVPDAEWPFDATWEPLDRLQSLEIRDPWEREQGRPVRDSRAARPVADPSNAPKRNRFGDVVRDDPQSAPLFEDGWWREQE